MFGWFRQKKKDWMQDQAPEEKEIRQFSEVAAQMEGQTGTGCPQNSEAVSPVTENGDARQLVDDLDQALRNGEMKIVCSRCKGTSWRYLSLYGLYQCTTPWCGNLRGGIQISPPRDRKSR